MTALLRAPSRIQADAFPIGKYSSTEDYISIDFYDYGGNEVTAHLRLNIPYEEAADLYLKIGRSLTEIEDARATRRLDAEVTT
jgi:hypothetical protein